MPINFDLEKIRKDNNCINYFETGLFNPKYDVSLKKALRCNFEKYFSIEIKKSYCDLGLKIFNKEISSGKLEIHNDDSSNISKYFNNECFKNKTLFFLDAHVQADDKDFNKYELKCPLINELNSIKELDRNDNIILVDDLRILKTPFPWGEKKYGNNNLFEMIKEQILNINSNYKFSFLDGVKKDDILYCYI